MTPQLLILRIQSVLSGNSDLTHIQKRSLAAEYKSVCENVAHKLEHCAALIKAGRDYTALQVAESRPPLLDSINALAFTEGAQWDTFCVSEGFPTPAHFDEYQISLVNALYTKHITQTHPLYRDYRRAVRLRDTRAALDVIKTITKINANDAEALGELEKISKKFCVERLSELEQSLKNSDDEKTAQIVKDVLENAASFIDADSAVWSAALARYRDLEYSIAQKRMAEIIAGLRAEGHLMECEDILSLASEFQTLRSANRVQVSEEDADFIERVSADAAEENDKKTAEADAVKARNEILMELETPSKRASNSKRAAYLRGLEKRAGSFLGEDLKAKLDAKLAAINRKIFFKRLFVTALAGGAICAATLAAYFIYAHNARNERMSEAQMQLAAAASLNSLSGSKSALETLRRNYPEELKRNKSLELEAQKTQTQLDAAQKQYDDLQAACAELMAFDFGTQSSARWQSAFDKLEASQAQALDFEKRFEAGISAKFAELKRTFQVKIDDRRKAVNKAVQDAFAIIENRLKELENVPQDYRAKEAELNAALDSAKPYVEDGSALFKVHAFDSEKFAQLGARAAETSQKLRDYEELKRSLKDSKTLDEYIENLDRLSKSASVSAKNATLMAGVIKMAPTLQDGAYAGICSPEAAAESSKDWVFARASGISKNEMFVNVYRYSNMGKPVYTLGKVSEKKSSWNTGNEIIQQAREVTYGGKISNSVFRFITIIGKEPKGTILTNESVPSETALGRDVSQKSEALPAISLLNVINSYNASPTFKMLLERAVFEEMKKDTVKSGLAYSPSARARLARLEEISRGVPVYEWMFENPSKANLINAELYSKPAPDYLREASLNRAAAMQISQNPMLFAGYADENGKPVLTSESAGAIWGISAQGLEFCALIANGKALKPFAPFSPLLLERMSKEEAFKRAAKAAENAK